MRKLILLSIIFLAGCGESVNSKHVFGIREDIWVNLTKQQQQAAFEEYNSKNKHNKNTPKNVKKSQEYKNGKKVLINNEKITVLFGTNTNDPSN